jgi:hypothetical protein
MKTYAYSLLAAAAACGFAAAETAYTTPVGYETLAFNTGFNFAGVRLQEAPVAAGDIEAISATTVTDSDIDFDTILTTGQSYVLEIQNGTGIVQVTGVWSGSDLTVAADLTGDVAIDDTYLLRPVSTLASVFGNAAAGHKLDIGAGGASGADQVWFWNGAGYDRYYFDEFGGPGFDQETWVNVDTSDVVDGSTINLIYTDGVIVSSANGKDVVVSGEVKTGPSELNLVGGFNFVGSVAPAGATLDALFGDTAAEVSASGLSIGAGGASGADQLWLWTGSGFAKYYFDEFGGPGFDQETWVDVDTSALIPATTPVPAGYIISAAGAGDVLSGVPDSFSSL